MATTQEFTGTLVVISCGECGTTFGVTEAFYKDRRQNATTFYCPNGHPRVYRETEEQRLRQQLANERANRELYEKSAQEQRELKEKAERRASAQKGVVTRLKNRTARGLCPICDQHFPSLKAHMHHEHPEFEQEETQ